LGLLKITASINSLSVRSDLPYSTSRTAGVACRLPNGRAIGKIRLNFLLRQGFFCDIRPCRLEGRLKVSEEFDDSIFRGVQGEINTAVTNSHIKISFLFLNEYSLNRLRQKQTN
jgi:hypothetical protein